MVAKSLVVGATAAVVASLAGCQFSRPTDITVDAAVDGPPVLTLMKSGDGTGAVSSNPIGIDCGVACPSATAPFAVGTNVTLSHLEGPDSEFVAWAGGCGGPTCTVAMTVDQTVTASFKRTDKLLTVQLLGQINGAGTATSDPAGIAGGQTTARFAHGTLVTLTAHWDPALQTFQMWGGDCSGSNTTCEVTMDVPRTVSATFTPL